MKNLIKLRMSRVFVTTLFFGLIVSTALSSDRVYHVDKTKGQLALIDAGLKSGLSKGQRLYVKRWVGTEYQDAGNAVVVIIAPNRAAVKRSENKNPKPLRVGDLIFESEEDREAYTSVYGAEGFQGVHWGRDIDKLGDIETLFDTGVSCNGIDFYQKLLDISEVDDVEIENIDYSFVDGKFAGVVLNTRGVLNFAKLKSACIKKFGKMDRINKELRLIFWKRDRVIIILKYDESSEEGSLFIASEQIYEQQKTYSLLLNN